MTVGRPITAGRSRDRCVSNVVSNPISDAARAPSPLYRARGQRRPSAASGLPIRNDFGTLSRVDRFQHGESQLRDLRDNLEWLEERLKSLLGGGKSVHGYWVRCLACASGSFCTHAGTALLGSISANNWAGLVEKAIAAPLQGTFGFLAFIAFWALILGTAKSGHFLRCFFRGLTVPVYVYYFLEIAFS